MKSGGVDQVVVEVFAVGFLCALGTSGCGGGRRVGDRWRRAVVG